MNTENTVEIARKISNILYALDRNKVDADVKELLRLIGRSVYFDIGLGVKESQSRIVFSIMRPQNAHIWYVRSVSVSNDGYTMVMVDNGFGILAYYTTLLPNSIRRNVILSDRASHIFSESLLPRIPSEFTMKNGYHEKYVCMEYWSPWYITHVIKCRNDAHKTKYFIVGPSLITAIHIEGKNAKLYRIRNPYVINVYTYLFHHALFR